MRFSDADRVQLYAAVGERLREHRVAAGKTIAVVAAEIGTSRSMLGKIEEGVQSCPLHLLYRAAMLFDVTLDDLVPVLTDP